MRTSLCLAVLVLAGTAGDLSVTRAMKEVGAVDDLRPSNVARAVTRALLRRWMWIGLLLQAVAFGVFLALLSWANVSVVVPASALSYVVGAFGAKLFLNEQVGWERWMAVLLIAFGVALVLAG